MRWLRTLDADTQAARHADRRQPRARPTSSSWAATTSRSTWWSARWPSAAFARAPSRSAARAASPRRERGQCDVAPVHLVDPATGVYNKHLLVAGLSLVKGWQRMQGVLFRPGDARFEGKRAEDAVKAALADPNLPDGQPQCRRRHPRADRQAARRARGRPATPTSRARTTRLPPRSRRRAPTGASRSSRWRRCTGLASCRSRRRITTSCWSRAAATARRCRRSSRRCATRGTRQRIAALGMQPADD